MIPRIVSVVTVSRLAVIGHGYLAFSQRLNYPDIETYLLRISGQLKLGNLCIAFLNIDFNHFKFCSCKPLF